MFQEAVLMEFGVSKQPGYTNSSRWGALKAPSVPGPKQKDYSCLNKGVNLL